MYIGDHSLFVTGTDTDVGKTFVSAMLTLGSNCSYWKPIQCGVEPCTDSQWIKQITGLPNSRFLPESYVLKQPLSPHAAAKYENIEIELEQIKPPANGPVTSLIIEGAGGLLVPINSSIFMVDLIKHLAIPVLLVARSTLGTINHSLMSIDVLRRAKIPIAGIVLNGPQNISNKNAIEYYGQVEVIAEIEPVNDVTFANLHRLYLDKFDSFMEKFANHEKSNFK